MKDLLSALDMLCHVYVVIFRIEHSVILFQS